MNLIFNQNLVERSGCKNFLVLVYFGELEPVDFLSGKKLHLEKLEKTRFENVFLCLICDHSKK